MTTDEECGRTWLSGGNEECCVSAAVGERRGGYTKNLGV